MTNKNITEAWRHEQHQENSIYTIMYTLSVQYFTHHIQHTVFQMHILHTTNCGSDMQIFAQFISYTPQYCRLILRSALNREPSWFLILDTMQDITVRVVKTLHAINFRLHIDERFQART